MTEPVEHADTERLRLPVRSLREPPSGVRLGSLPGDSAQDLRFVQERVAFFAKVTFLISGMFLVVGGAADAIREINRMAPLGRACHVLGTLIALGLWRLLRRPHNYSPAMLNTLDIAGTLGVCVSFVFMGHHSVQPYGFYTGLLAITHVSISRAMIVPSVPQRTLLLTMASFVGLVVSRSVLPLAPEVAQVSGARARDLVEAVLWSAAGCAVATVASTVIYGLHEKAREARQLGQYTLEAKIGEGGMGEIYRARHAMLRRPTAVKLLVGHGSEEQLRRFEKEVQLTARLTHPNTISVYDYGRTPDGIFYYAMELLDGLTVQQLVERHGPQPAGRVIHLLLQVCGALKEAHRIGLIHRDIKPANIYVCNRGDIPDFVKVLDFGLVREIRSDGDRATTSANTIVGTPLYMAPEALLTPDQIDARADIYGLGGVAYFLVTGTPPFAGESLVELCGHHLHTPPEPPSLRRPTPGDLERIILSCLAKKPEERPQTVFELAQALKLCHDAEAWNATDAEAWWANAGNGAPLAPPQQPVSGEPPRRTLLYADLEQRLGMDEPSNASKLDVTRDLKRVRT